ncbi:MAG TPA: tetratricopeptide repeat protein [Solirubrobacteraceae bacterium]|nr:tetratricopeptide repeat protein [Solirubrobacteraceae bacterium]
MRLRLAAAALAVVVAALLGARLHDHDRCEAARKEVFAIGVGSPTAGARDALRRIRESCRGTTALVASAAALHRAGRERQALRLAREATREEPDNAAAWRALATVAADQAPAEARAAEERLAELDPLGSLNRSTGRSTR